MFCYILLNIVNNLIEGTIKVKTSMVDLIIEFKFKFVKSPGEVLIIHW